MCGQNQTIFDLDVNSDLFTACMLFTTLQYHNVQYSMIKNRSWEVLLQNRLRAEIVCGNDTKVSLISLIICFENVE